MPRDHRFAPRGGRRHRSDTRPRKADFGARLMLGPRPEPLWRRIACDARTVTEAIFTDVHPDPTHPQPTPRHFVLDLFINNQLRDTRVFHAKQEALTQGIAWFRQYESPYHRLAMRLHVPDAIAARGTLGVRLPRNGQSLVCELFAFHNGLTWQILLNADGRPLLTRDYRTEEAAFLDAWSVAWKLQGHALPWPAHWLPTPPIVRKAMERYDRVPTLEETRSTPPPRAATVRRGGKKPALTTLTPIASAPGALSSGEAMVEEEDVEGGQGSQAHP